MDIMNKSILIYLALFLVISCNSEAENSFVNDITSEVHKIDTIFEMPESVVAEWDGEYEAYNGDYFSVQYPSNFIAQPLEPTDQIDDYEFIRTDEATFTSPDGEVEFFVYSPLWGGEPEFYLEFLDNEELTEEKESIETDEFGQEKTIQWMTFTDKDGNYSRSYVSTKTESTFLVFGIKSFNDAAYEKYKERYLKFKESLQQFADA
jgi:hypothetical protein